MGLMRPRARWVAISASGEVDNVRFKYVYISTQFMHDSINHLAYGTINFMHSEGHLISRVFMFCIATNKDMLHAVSTVIYSAI